MQMPIYSNDIDTHIRWEAIWHLIESSNCTMVVAELMSHAICSGLFSGGLFGSQQSHLAPVALPSRAGRPSESRLCVTTLERPRAEEAPARTRSCPGPRGQAEHRTGAATALGQEPVGIHSPRRSQDGTGPRNAGSGSGGEPAAYRLFSLRQGN